MLEMIINRVVGENHGKRINDEMTVRIIAEKMIKERMETQMGTKRIDQLG